MILSATISPNLRRRFDRPAARTSSNAISAKPQSILPRSSIGLFGKFQGFDKGVDQLNKYTIKGTKVRFWPEHVWRRPPQTT